MKLEYREARASLPSLPSQPSWGKWVGPTQNKFIVFIVECLPLSSSRQRSKMLQVVSYACHRHKAEKESQLGMKPLIPSHNDTPLPTRLHFLILLTYFGYYWWWSYIFSPCQCVYHNDFLLLLKSLPVFLTLRVRFKETLCPSLE